MRVDKRFWLCLGVALLIPSSVSAPVRDNKKTEPIAKVELKRNYPNPFEKRTTIEYTLSDSANVVLIIFDKSWNPLDTLVNQKQGSGTYKAEFDATGYSSGLYPYRLETLGKKAEVYFYQLRTDHFFDYKKMLRLVD